MFKQKLILIVGFCVILGGHAAPTPQEEDDTLMEILTLIETAKEFASGAHQLVHRAETKGLTYEEAMNATEELKDMHEDIDSLSSYLIQLAEDARKDRTNTDATENDTKDKLVNIGTIDKAVVNNILIQALKKIEVPVEDILSLILGEGLLGTDNARLELSTKLLNKIATEGLSEATENLKTAVEDGDNTALEPAVYSMMHFAHAMDITLKSIQEAFEDAALLVERESSDDDDVWNWEWLTGDDDDDDEDRSRDDDDEDRSRDDDDDSSEENNRRQKRDTKNPFEREPIASSGPRRTDTTVPKFNFTPRDRFTVELGRGWSVNKDTLKWRSNSGNTRFDVSPDYSNKGVKATFNHRFSWP